MNKSTSANNDYWSKDQIEREENFPSETSWDSFISDDHLIRAYDLILSEVDWSCWDSVYVSNRGQPPIRPFYLAGILLYGISERIRSSRDLEKACKLRIDFKWFLRGIEIDHSTFCNFRNNFEKELKVLAKQMKILAKELMNGGESIAVDGTRIRSNSSRHGAKRAKTLEKKLTQLADNLQKRLQEMAIEDALTNPDKAKISDLNKAIKCMNNQKERLEKALDVANKKDDAKQKKSKKTAKPVRVPVTDSDSQITPNKEGGFAPNFTPTAAVDIETGIILHNEVPEGSDEASVVPKVVEDVEDIYGEKPKNILGDGAFKTGENLEFLDKNNVRAVAPVFNIEGNPAIRENPRVAISKEDYDKLPLYGKKIDKSAFIYDKENDIYLCPMGRELPHKNTAINKIKNRHLGVRRYVSKDCSDCPLSGKCLLKAKKRMVTRDDFEPYREDLVKYMSTKEGKALYKKRAPNIEGLFGHIKENLGIRQFYFRGIRKVRNEWNWICLACNLRKISKSILSR